MECLQLFFFLISGSFMATDHRFIAPTFSCAFSLSQYFFTTLILVLSSLISQPSFPLFFYSSPDRANSEPVHAHSFSFGSYFPEGLSAMTYVAKHNLLLVGGSPYSSGERMACGISGWRLLDAPPYWGPRLGQQIEKVLQDI